MASAPPGWAPQLRAGPAPHLTPHTTLEVAPFPAHNLPQHSEAAVPSPLAFSRCPGEVRTPIPVSEWQALLVLPLCVLNFTSTNDPLDPEMTLFASRMAKHIIAMKRTDSRMLSDARIAQQARLHRTGLKPPRGAGRKKVRLSDMAPVTAATQEEPLPLCFEV